HRVDEFRTTAGVHRPCHQRAAAHSGEVLEGHPLGPPSCGYDGDNAHGLDSRVGRREKKAPPAVPETGQRPPTVVGLPNKPVNGNPANSEYEPLIRHRGHMWTLRCKTACGA